MLTGVQKTRQHIWRHSRCQGHNLLITSVLNKAYRDVIFNFLSLDRIWYLCCHIQTETDLSLQFLKRLFNGIFADRP